MCEPFTRRVVKIKEFRLRPLWRGVPLTTTGAQSRSQVSLPAEFQPLRGLVITLPASSQCLEDWWELGGWRGVNVCPCSANSGGGVQEEFTGLTGFQVENGFRLPSRSWIWHLPRGKEGSGSLNVSLVHPGSGLNPAERTVGEAGDCSGEGCR